MGKKKGRVNGECRGGQGRLWGAGGRGTHPMTPIASSSSSPLSTGCSELRRRTSSATRFIPSAELSSEPTDSRWWGETGPWRLPRGPPPSATTRSCRLSRGAAKEEEEEAEEEGEGSAGGGAPRAARAAAWVAEEPSSGMLLRRLPAPPPCEACLPEARAPPSLLPTPPTSTSEAAAGPLRARGS